MNVGDYSKCFFFLLIQTKQMFGNQEENLNLRVKETYFEFRVIVRGWI